MNPTHLKTMIALVSTLSIGHVYAGRDVKEGALRMLANRTGAVARVETAQLPKVQLADMIDQADLIVIGQYVAPPMACVTNAAGSIQYSVPVNTGRRVSLHGGLYELNDIAVDEIVASTDDAESVKDRFVSVGKGTPGIHVVMKSYSDPVLLYGGGSMLLFLKRYPIAETDATAIHVATTDMVFRVVQKGAGCVYLQEDSIMPCEVAEAVSAKEILQVTRYLADQLLYSNTNKQYCAYSESNTGLCFRTVQQMAERKMPKKFKTTSMKIERNILDPHGNPMR